MKSARRIVPHVAFGICFGLAGLLPQAVQAQIQRADRNNDRRLQFDEFQEFLQATPRLRPLAARAQAVFARLDQDQSGDLDPTEIQQLAAMQGRGGLAGRPGAARPAGKDDGDAKAANPLPDRARGAMPQNGMRGRGAAPQFRFIDRDRDGAVSEQEFQQFTTRNPMLRGNAELAQRFFARLDTDSDGKLSPSEFQRIGTAMQQLGNRGRQGQGPRQNPFPRFVASIRRGATATTEEAASPAQALTSEQIAFFEEKIQPVLVGKCNRCHSADAATLRGGLRVDTRHGLLVGGESGAAVVSGKPEESPLYLALIGDGYSQMPPKDRLPDEVVQDFQRWIEMGAPDPRRDEFQQVRATPRDSIDIEAGRQHWSFQAPRKQAAPEVQDATWPLGDIDRHVLAQLEEQGLTPAKEADRQVLIRRVTFDLTGLPPTPAEVAEFLADPADTVDALATVVDRLLESPQFGERWGRHWLDVARYAESTGKEFDVLYPHAWRYRDYVIDAFNEDKPYDRFLREQLAGDLLPASTPQERADLQIATGYLAVGSKSPRETDLRKLVLDIADEQIDAVSRGVLGVSIACARCHDHKFEPISQRDYYALAGIFASTETLYGGVRSLQVRNTTELISLPEGYDSEDPAPLSSEQVTQLRERLDAVRAEMREQGITNPNASPEARRLVTQAQQLAGRLERYRDDGSSKSVAMGVREWQACDIPLFVRGDLDKPAEIVPRGLVEVLNLNNTEIQSGSGRLELAEWIASPDNPLTARVMVNRIWLHLFGRGLVTTPDDLGATGEAPSHPQLLDNLAVDFMEQGWSIKTAIRQMVLTQTYMMSSAEDAKNMKLDPDNRYLWRHNPQRLEAEAIRDAMLFASGQLNLERPVGSLIARLGDGLSAQLDAVRSFAERFPNAEQLRAMAARMQQQGGGQAGQFQRMTGALAAQADPNREGNHRSVYLPVVRTSGEPVLEVFDFPDSSLVTGMREQTTVATQGLYLLNADFVLQQADAMAERVANAAASREDQVALAFQLALGRTPTAEELDASLEFLESFPASQPAGRRFGAFARRRLPQKSYALSALCQSLFATAEFRQTD